MLVLGIEGCRRHFGDHEAGVEAGIWSQEWRQAKIQRGVDEGSNAPLADGADLGQDKRNLVGGKGDRLGVKISTRDDLSGLNQHQRIVRDGVGFDRQGKGGLHQEIERGAGHLRLAAQAIGILDPRIAGDVARADRGAGHQRAQGVGDEDLAAVAAEGVDTRIERRV